jgi:SAM-dependent methyltransferase
VRGPLHAVAHKLQRHSLYERLDWARLAPFPELPPDRPRSPAWCVICRWQGEAFDGGVHCEAAQCPCCGSIARDRFLFWCLLTSGPEPGSRVLETSPRLDERYRRAMSRWFTYRASDYDGRAHRGGLHLDLQDIGLPDASLDVVLSPHVLEHVPDTERAITELHRVLVPGGLLLLQVPVLQGTTAPPERPEFHGDDTVVHWRFGYDLTARLRRHGFAVDALVTDEWAAMVRAGTREVRALSVSREFNLPSMLAHADPDDLHPVMRAADALQNGAVPGYMFLTWRCVKTAR